MRRLVEELLRSCRVLRILATSQEALNVAGEAIWQVVPLSGPDLQRIPPADHMARCEAARLFVERAAAARLDERFRLLTAGTRTGLAQHQTWRAAMDWSNDAMTS